MTTPLRTTAGLMAALWLTACGGGGSPIATTADSCDLPLQYANAATAGYTITANMTATVPRKFANCPLKSMQSARLSLCLDHPQISELRAQMRLPDGTTRPLDLSSGTAGATCLITGKLLNMSVPISALQPFEGLRGDWSVAVNDIDQVSSTRLGYLLGWSMQVDGFK